MKKNFTLILILSLSLIFSIGCNPVEKRTNTTLEVGKKYLFSLDFNKSKPDTILILKKDKKSVRWTLTKYKNKELWLATNQKFFINRIKSLD